MAIARTLTSRIFSSTQLALQTPRNALLVARPRTPSLLALFPRTFSTMGDTTKTLPVLDASELAEGSMKTVEFDGGKVLLSKINGQVHATSAHCTHYGAPLEKGVLSANGRIVCPWHGACFNVCTGDIEDAPGLDSLWKYTAEVRDGKIFVTAPEKEVKAKVGRVIARPRAPLAATLKEKVVIVGGGSGGIHTIESLREHNFAGDIVLISQEDYAPIDRTKLSKALQDDPTKVEWRKPAELKDDFGVELHLATTVSAIDTAAQTVTIPSGQIKYDHLVLSPGATPRRIPIPGADLPGVVTIRTPHDVKKVTEALGPNTDIIVIGTSFIGLEATGALTKKEKKSLTVVGVDPVPFEAMLGRDLGKAIQKSYEDQGVTFHMDTQIEKITAGPDGKAAQLHIKGKDPLPASLVIMGTGVAPATSFLKDSSSFTLERDGGITVDEYLRVPGAKNVYAIGDIAHYPQFPDGNPRRVEHWNVAGNHGRHVAATIAGTPKPYKGVPIFWSSIGKGLRYVGTGAGFDDTYLDGSITDLKFVLYQAKGGKITAVASMGRDPYVSKSSELLKLGKMPTLDEIKVGKNILEIQA